MRQSIDGLGRRLEDVDETLMRTHLKLFTRILIDMRGTKNRIYILLCGEAESGRKP